MDIETSMAEANRILREAGWTPVRSVVATGGESLPNTEGAFAFVNLVCGHPPEGANCTFVAKELSKIPQEKAAALGFDPADYPDEHHEAAAWLIEHVKPVNVMSMASLAEQQAIAETEALFAEGEAAYGGGNGEAETHSDQPVGADEQEAESGDTFDAAPEDADGTWLESAGEVAPNEAAEDSFDLGSIEDYTLDTPALEGAEPTDADFSEPDGPAGQFIFGDNLYQMRVAAIGLVTVKAASIMPAVDLVRIAELRNFTLGVSEKRWDDDPAKREELDTLEATARLANAIAKARDDKAAYLLDASREQVEAFDVEADWP